MATNRAEGRKRSMLKPGYRTQDRQPIELGIFRPSTPKRLQLGHWLTSVGDDERPALTDLLQVPSEPGLQFSGAHRRMSSHVVMMTTRNGLVNQARQDLAWAAEATRTRGGVRAAQGT